MRTYGRRKDSVVRVTAITVGVVVLSALIVLTAWRTPLEEPRVLDKTEDVTLQPGDDAMVPTFYVQSLSPADRHLKGQLSLRTTAYTKEHLTDIGSQTRVADCQRPSTSQVLCHPKEGEGGKLIFVDLEVFKIPRSGPFIFKYRESRSIKLSDLFAVTPQPTDPAFVDTIELPIDGNPAKYPNDTYSTALLLSLHSEDVTLPARVQPVYGSATLGDLDLELAGDAFTIVGIHYEYQPATLYFHRPRLDIVYVYLVVIALPVLLLFVAFSLLYRHRSESSLPDFFAAFAVVAVTFLLLRPVVVPTSIGVLTSVDYILAMAVFLMIVGPVVPNLIRRGSPRQMDEGTPDQGRRAHNVSKLQTIALLMLAAAVAMLPTPKRARKR